MGEVPAADEPRPGHLVADRYRLERRVARGGMAWVWAAHDTLLDRPVALKFPLAQLRSRPDFLARFRREAVAAARLNHPNVVAVYDTGEDPELGAYIVMELVPGPSLRHVLHQESTLAVDRAVAVATQVANALDFAHTHGIVHRDVKPANVLLDEGRVKVVDFGIAKAAMGDDGLTKTDVTLGTARYISPEQVEGAAPDARSDLYSLGVVLYEMVCGRTPFDADSDLALAVKHLHDEPPPPSLARPDVPAWLEGVILTALAKAPQDRYQSAAEMRQALLQRGAMAPAPPPVATAAPVEAVTAPQPRDAAPSGTGTADADPTRAAAAPTRALAAAPHTSGPAGLGEGTARLGPAAGSAAAVIDQTPPPAPDAPPERALGHRPDRAGGPAGRPAGAPPGKRAVPVVALLVAAAAVALAAAVIGGIAASRGGTGGGQRSGATGSAAGSQLAVAGARSFDPQGDGTEHDELLGNLTDHNPSTYWETSHYDSPSFGNLKSGVGVILQLSRPADVSELSIDSPDSGWAYQVYLSDSSPSTLSGWGSPVASGRVDSPTTAVSVGGRSARYVLVWITNLGQGNSSVRVGELSVAS